MAQDRKRSDSPVLVWFGRDLRLHDNPALHAAIGEGGTVLPVFLADDGMGAASRWWLHHSLTALGADLAAIGAPLVLRRGPPEKIIADLVTETGARAVHVGEPPEPAGRAAIDAVRRALAPGGVPVHGHRSELLFGPAGIRTKGGTPFHVYTPFSRTCLDAGVPPDLLAKPSHIAAPNPPRSDTLADWKLLPTKPDWAGGMRATWQPGEAGAASRLRDFMASHVGAYDQGRNLPDKPGTSMLSPHLHWGELSPGQVWHASTQADPDGQGGRIFRNELLWREFCAHLLHHHPDLPDKPLRPEFAAMAWRTDPAGEKAWQQGRTGIPMVDAGMRQLWQIGWMHNRVRMIVASFLIKHLLIDWRAGADWFWDTLVDADLASNSANWQWVAGCGADAAPFFRVFNPVLQGRKFDPDGGYVRRWVPELARLPDRHIHAPWEAPEDVLAQAWVTLGRDYPRPIVDLGAGRERALAAFKAISRSVA